MRTAFLLLTFSLALPILLAAQCEFYQPRHMASGYIQATDAANGLLALDSSGNVYTAQLLGGGTINFGNSHSVSGLGSFIVGYNSGNAFWTKLLSTSDYNAIADMQVDEHGNIFLTGTYETSMTVDNHSVSGASNNFQAFVMKIDSTGNCQWLHTSTGNNNMNVGSDNDAGQFITPDENGGCFVTIYYNCLFTLDTFVVSTTFSSSTRNSVIAHYDSNGNLTWLRKVHSIDGNQTTPLVVSDKNGGAFMILSLSWALDLDTATLNSYTTLTTYVVHVNEFGHYDWINYIYNAGMSNAARCLDDGTLLLAGEYRDSVRIGTNLAISPNTNSLYFSKIDKFGNPLFLHSIATVIGLNDQLHLAPDGLDVRSDGGIYVAGYMIGSADFNGLVKSDTAGPLFAVRYDSGMNTAWCKVFGKGAYPNAPILPYGIRTTPCNSAVVGGAFLQDINILPAHLIAPNAGYDFYLAEFNAINGNLFNSGIGVEEQLASNHFSVFPNPTSDYLELKLDNAQNFNGETIYINDVLGQSCAATKVEMGIDGNLRIDVSGLSPGVYFLCVGNGEVRPVCFVKR